MLIDIRELKIVCPHCNAENKVTCVAEIETFRIDCSRCRRTIGFGRDLIFKKDAKFPNQERLAA